MPRVALLKSAGLQPANGGACTAAAAAPLPAVCAAPSGVARLSVKAPMRAAPALPAVQRTQDTALEEFVARLQNAGGLLHAPHTCLTSRLAAVPT